VSSRITNKDAFVALFEKLGFHLDSEDTTSSFFWLFVFSSKLPDHQSFISWNQEGWEEAIQREEKAEKGLVKEGEALLKPCLYKKR
jgi:trimethylamine:corrinoid methyltransferase-like protein